MTACEWAELECKGPFPVISDSNKVIDKTTMSGLLWFCIFELRRLRPHAVARAQLKVQKHCRQRLTLQTLHADTLTAIHRTAIGDGIQMMHDEKSFLKGAWSGLREQFLHFA